MIKEDMQDSYFVSNKTFFVVLPEEFNDFYWSSRFGTIQYALKGHQFDKQLFTAATFDLSECRWASPTPLLSLMMAANRYTLDGGFVTFILPSSNSSDSDKRRFIKFVTTEGFFDQMVNDPISLEIPRNKRANPQKKVLLKEDNGVLTECTNQSDHKKAVAKITQPLMFDSAACLNACILNLNCDTEQIFAQIDHWTNTQLDNVISSTITNVVPYKAQISLKHRISTILKECLNNIYEHAYTSTFKQAAIYIRYREGARVQHKTTWDSQRLFRQKEMTKDCYPALANTFSRKHFLEEAFGAIEIFIADMGVGIVNSFKDRYLDEVKAATSTPSPQHFPPRTNQLNQILVNVLVKGDSSKRDRSISTNGLKHIRTLLEKTGDYFRAFDNDEWWGAQLPYRRNSKTEPNTGQTVYPGGARLANNFKTTGCCLTFRLTWSLPNDFLDKNQYPWQDMVSTKKDKKYRDRMLSHFKNSEPDEVHDLSGTDVFTQQDSIEHLAPEYAFPTNSHRCLWIPNVSLGKRIIFENIAKLGRRYSTVYIANIEAIETSDYIAALHNSVVSSKLDRIYLITKDLNCLCLIMAAQDRKLVSSRQHSVAFFSTNTPELNLHDYVRLFRSYLSKSFWKRVNQHKGAYIDENITWAPDLEIHGYLDFPLATTDTRIKHLLTESLSLFKALLPRHTIEFKPIDVLVKSYISRLNAHLRSSIKYSTSTGDRLTVAVSSVLASGKSLRENPESIEDQRSVIFFRHPSGRKLAPKEYALLQWSPISDNPPQDNTKIVKYERIGTSHNIARGGWKSFTVPRFDSENKAIHERSPRESYQIWQDYNRTGLKLGHWAYGPYHDLISLNLLNAFDTELDDISLDAEGSLARFLVGNLTSSLALDDNELTDAGRDLVRAWISERRKYLSASKQAAIIIYISHTTTDHVINQFLSYISDASKAAVLDRIVPIPPTDRAYSGITAKYSGLTLERLKSLHNERKYKSVVFLDDALRSGRTYSEVKSLCASLGFTTFYSLTIIDRQRLPGSSHVANSQHTAYWRLDVPALGDATHCAICLALGKARQLLGFLVHPDSKARVLDWAKTWEAADTILSWGDKGLRQRPILLSKPNKRFGLQQVRDINGTTTYKQPGGDYQRIQITTDLGLITWLIELHTLTGRNDLVYSLRKEEPNIDRATFIKMLCSEILLFKESLSYSSLENIVATLWEQLWDSSQLSRETSLAALTLLSLNENVLCKCLISFFDKHARAINRSLQFPTRNLDCRLTYSYCLSNLGSAVTSQNLSALYSIDSTHSAARLLLPAKKNDIYYRLHRESKDELGRSHTEPLHNFLKLDHFTVTDIKPVVHGVEQLLAAIESLRYWWLMDIPNEPASELIAERNVSHETDSRGLLTHTKAQLNAFLKTAQSTEHDTTFVSSLRTQASQLLIEIDQLHKRLLFPIGILALRAGEQSHFEQYLEVQIASQRIPARIHVPSNFSRKSQAVLLKPELSEAYLVFDSDVKRALRDFLSNARHPNEPTESPWLHDNEGENQGTSNSWVNVRFDINGAHVSLANLIDAESREKIKERTPTSHVHEDIQTVGGRFTYEFHSKFNRDYVFLDLFIPFVHIRM